jgi:hypothetical protein
VAVRRLAAVPVGAPAGSRRERSPTDRSEVGRAAVRARGRGRRKEGDCGLRIRAIIRARRI